MFFYVNSLLYFVPKYSSARVPKELFDTVKKFISEHPEMGYRSVSELVDDLLRRELNRSKDKG